MADHEDISSLSAEEKIARILDELGSRIDSQAERLTEQLAPVEKKVSAIEEQLRILGHDRGTPAPPHERYRPRATHESESAAVDAPPPAMRDPEETEFDDTAHEEAELDAPAPEMSEPEERVVEEPVIEPPIEPTFDPMIEPIEEAPVESTNESTTSGEQTPADPEPTKVEPEEPAFEGPKLVAVELDSPEAGAPPVARDIEPPRPNEPDPEHPPVPQSDSADEIHSPDHDREAPNDLPFETDGLSDEDIDLADKALKSDLVGLFDDGEHANEKPASPDTVAYPTPFPTAATPTRSRPVYLLLVAFLFLAASAGIGAFIWIELTSPELPFASDEQRPDETSDPAPATDPPNPSSAPVQTATPDTDRMTTPATPKPSDVPERPAPERAARETPAPAPTTEAAPTETASIEKTSPETTPSEATPENPASQPGTTDAPVAAKTAPANPEIDTLRDLATAGDPDAQYEIAVRYLVGRGIEQDYVQAAKWLQEAAAGGVTSAQYNLGVLYDSGRGVEADPVEALIWFHSAAEKGHGRAQYALAAAYAAGRGIERDSDMALKWLRRAAAENILEAQSSLANILATSPVSRDSLEEAYYWYRLADANGDGAAADKADLVAARLTPEERADVNRRVSSFIAANITGTRRRNSPGAAPAPPAPPAAIAESPNRTTPATGTQTAETSAGASPETARIRTIQTLLTRLGFETGTADGALGAQTREAIRNYQRALGLDIDGEPTEALLTHLRQVSGVRR